MGKTNGNGSNLLKVTSADEWGDLYRNGVLVPLASGRVARLRPVGIEELVRSGKIPDDLSPLAAEVVWMSRPEPGTVRSLGKRAIEMLNIVVAAAFMEPRVVIDTEPGEGEISIDWIDVIDKGEVFAWVTAPVSMLATFRARQAASMAALHAGNEAGTKAE
jgi:hypothetical protein